ncbi:MULTISPECIES: PLP-dependent transferase [Marinilabilia]|uniref:O-acetylhomoserine (Thiol)-lyase n=1 Tax=Marinilabilia salmonicolor TaxID=989 RepID=A0A368VDB2_9BACT|nr:MULTISPECIES: PLP-dependent transferase [Marinilabilia]RCW39096.1 O-acetylhomoserine (thiol)-lyase [Marinilabilia salmonicolor]
MKSKNISTRILHTPFLRKDSNNSLRMPIYENVAFEFETAQEIEAAFRGEIPRHVYSRIANPTVEHFENQIKEASGALGVLAVGSGMATLANLFVAIAAKGNNIITTNKLFGNTFSLVSTTLPSIGIEFRLADMTDPQSVEKLVDSKTVGIFFETITNPQLEVADVKALSQIAQKHKIPLICDTTLTPPDLFTSADFGVDVELISGTKFISGGATALGGLIIDNGSFNWSHNENLKPFHDQVGPLALIARLRKEVARNLGATLSAHNAFLLSLGLETLTLRTNKACQNTLETARWLEKQAAVKRVDYPGLESSPFFDLSRKQFNGKPGAVLTFDLDSKESCFKFINALKMIRKATNINDNKTLILHPASTIFCEYDKQTLDAMQIRQTTVRLAPGIEEAEDIIADVENALGAV